MKCKNCDGTGQDPKSEWRAGTCTVCDGDGRDPFTVVVVECLSCHEELGEWTLQDVRQCRSLCCSYDVGILREVPDTVAA